jgi:hypothetical protein
MTSGKLVLFLKPSSKILFKLKTINIKIDIDNRSEIFKNYFFYF